MYLKNVNSDSQIWGSLSRAFVPLTISFDRTLLSLLTFLTTSMFDYLSFSYNLTNTTEINGQRSGTPRCPAVKHASRHYVITLVGYTVILKLVRTCTDRPDGSRNDSESEVSSAKTIRTQQSLRTLWCHISANMRVCLTSLIEIVVWGRRCHGNRRICIQFMGRRKTVLFFFHICTRIYFNEDEFREVYDYMLWTVTDATILPPSSGGQNIFEWQILKMDAVFASETL